MFSAGGAAYGLGFKSEKPTHDIYVILDDAGGSSRDVANIQSLLRTNIPLNLAIMPDTPYTSQVVKLMNQEDFYALLHIPGEPVRMVERGLKPEESGRDNGIYHDTPVEQVEPILRKNFELINPNHLEKVVGLNFHMGSLVSENGPLMEAVGNFLKKQGMIFIDSNTYDGVPRARAYDIIRQQGVISGIRNTDFLDNTTTKSHTLGKLKKMEQKAIITPVTVAIGHIGHTSTKDALIEFVESYQLQGGDLIKDVGPCILRLMNIRDFRGL